MQRFPWFPTLSLMGALLLGGCTLSPEAIDRRGRGAVVLINYQDQPGFGTGFLVEHGGIGCAVLTAAHVVEPSPDRLNVTVAEDDQLYQDVLVTPAEGYDLALIRFQPEGTGDRCPYGGLPLGVTQAMTVGNPLWLIGYPDRAGENRELILQTLEGKVTTVELPREGGLGLAYDIISAAGMSGGPVLNQRGQVVAIHSQADRDRQGNEFVKWGVDIQLAFQALSLEPPVSPWQFVLPGLGRSLLIILGAGGAIVVGQTVLQTLAKSWQSYQADQELKRERARLEERLEQQRQAQEARKREEERLEQRRLAQEAQQQEQERLERERQKQEAQQQWVVPPPSAWIATPQKPAAESKQPLTLNLKPKKGGKTVPLELLPIPGGTFWMGQTEAETKQLKKEAGEDTYKQFFACELPRHRVTVPPFWMGRFPVTQAQYEAVMGDNPTRGKAWVYNGQKWEPNQPIPEKFLGDDKPVIGVSWDMAVKFCEVLNRLEKDYQFRLPTEAEWEYACRAGTETAFYFGDRLEPHQANYGCNHSYNGSKTAEWKQVTTPVGQFPANDWGLQDMHGNVWEWCADEWYDSYAQKPEKLKKDGSDPWTKKSSGISPSIDGARLLRGGSWYDNPRDCRSARRFRYDRTGTNNYTGFRVVVAVRTS
ncbi:MAG: SUMF1/EgtB/PvdO family nonheme iron enzyme [Prochlorotrichaceae cyanobacterium]